MTALDDLIDQIRSACDPEAIRREERSRLAAALIQAGYAAHATAMGRSLPAWVAQGCPTVPAALSPIPCRGEFEPIPGLKMLRIPAGSFMMGSPPEEPGRYGDEGPQHRVTLPALFMGQTPITQAQWREVAGWLRVEMDLQPDPSHFKGDQRPVERVSWLDAMEFCRRLSRRTGRIYTLPSEAQWEYACRAGTTTPFHFGATISTELANYDGSAAYGDGLKGDNRQETTDVASFPANAWDLHDMHGDVWEWCLDDWHANHEGAPENGSAWLEENSLGKSCAAALGTPLPSSAARPPASGTSRSTATTIWVSASVAPDQRKVLRGGSWNNLPQDCRSAYRNCFRLGDRDYSLGFRVCCLP